MKPCILEVLFSVICPSFANTSSHCWEVSLLTLKGDTVKNKGNGDTYMYGILMCISLQYISPTCSFRLIPPRSHKLGSISSSFLWCTVVFITFFIKIGLLFRNFEIFLCQSQRKQWHILIASLKLYKASIIRLPRSKDGEARLKLLYFSLRKRFLTFDEEAQ